MLKQRLPDTSVWVVALSALLTLSSVSLIFCPTAHAGSAPGVPATPTNHTPTEASKTAMTIEDDDDGNELLEHWGDPKYSREERLQMAWMIGGLSVFGAANAVRRSRRRREARNG